MQERGYDVTVIAGHIQQLYAHMGQMHYDIKDVLVHFDLGIGHCADMCCLVVKEEMD